MIREIARHEARTGSKAAAPIFVNRNDERRETERLWWLWQAVRMDLSALRSMERERRQK